MRKHVVCSALLGALLLAPSAARAVPISGSAGLNGLGSFTGTFDYTPDAVLDTIGTITIVLNNTSPLFDGFLTGFVFNLPDGVTVTAASLNTPPTSDPDFAPLGALTFNNNVNGAPFGHFDIGAAVGGNFQGGGNPSDGIAAGSSGTFQFALIGEGLLGVTSADFLSSLSVPPGAGEGLTPFEVRFRGFVRELETEPDSDHVPLDTPIPEPGTLILVSLGLATLSARRLHSRKH